jgi:hypothetical protein
MSQSYESLKRKEEEEAVLQWMNWKS